MDKEKPKYIRDGRAPIPEKEITSKIMSKIKGKDTKPEIRFRKMLWNYGVKGYRIHWKKVPGNPDIAFPGKKIAIFVNGCFWHRHSNCKLASTPGSNTDFWEKKFAANVKRDKRNKDDLEKMGWRVIIVWECQIKKQENLENLVKSRIAPLLKSDFIRFVAEKPSKQYNSLK